MNNIFIKINNYVIIEIGCDIDGNFLFTVGM